MNTENIAITTPDPTEEPAITIPVILTMEEIAQLAAEKLASVIASGTNVSPRRIIVSGCGAATALSVRPTDKLTIELNLTSP